MITSKEIGLLHQHIAPFQLTISDAEATRVLEAALKQWEAETNHKPFIVKNYKEAYNYIVPINSTDSTVVLDNSARDIEVRFNGILLKENEDYRIVTPWQIEFLKLGYKGCTVEINALWGYATEFPEDVSLALVYKACSITMLATNPVLLMASKLIQEGVDIDFGGAKNNLHKHYDSLFREVVERYRRRFW